MICGNRPICGPSGSACTFSVDCCEGGCVAGSCDDSASCASVSDTCTVDADCCSGNCDGGSCLPGGGGCEADPEGIVRCRKRMGHPGAEQPEPICLPAGELCENDAHCCSGSCLQLRDDPPVGPQFPKRCTDLDCDPRDGPPCCRPDGEMCADPAECCGGICVLHGDTFRCGPPPPPPPADAGVDAGPPPDGGYCIPRGDDCTTDSDCCMDLFCVPVGPRLVCDVPILI